VSILEKRVGAVRPTQLIHSFGIGSIIDLPHFSAMLLGLEDWPEGFCGSIAEERLLRAVQKRLGAQVEKLAAPPFEEDEGLVSASDRHIGLPVVAFPRHLRCPFCSLLAPIDRFAFRTTPGRPDKAAYHHKNCNKANDPTVVPARFLVACESGHIDDFPWHEFVHEGKSDCPSDLRLEETGGTEATSVLVSCMTCGAGKKSMATAFSRDGNLPPCRGRRPHLRDFESDKCGAPAKALLLGASNAWFAVSLSALHIPHAQESKLLQLVEEVWGTLQKAKSADIVEYLMGEGKLGSLSGYSPDEIFAAVVARRDGTGPEEPSDLKVPEWDAFTRVDPKQQTTDFEIVEVAPPSRYASVISRVVLARRIREVTALLGFTRLESPRDYSGDSDMPGPKRMGLSRKAPRFVPASEVRGEGIFLQFDEKRLTKWCDQQADLDADFLSAHTAWRKRRKIEPPAAGFPGARYILLHSFAHALMRQLALECGYAAASLRERIYSNDDEAEGPRMAGILVYTSAPDSEGTLGGLVRMGRPEELGRHIRGALEAMKLCSSDPLCADMRPDPDGSKLHAAACHACLFAPETSCERGNKYLDRGALVATVYRSSGFFDEAKDT
jgi:hypothetical protein